MPNSITLPDSLYQRLHDRFGAALNSHVVASLERSLADPDVDALTDCRSRSALSYDLLTAVDEAIRHQERFRQTALCCDIEDFSRFVDHHGFGPSDDLLVRLASRLLDTKKSAYRVGGDDFIVLGQPSTLPALDEELGVHIRQCVVEVDLSLNCQRRRRATSWILCHLYQALVQPAILGEPIVCRDHPDWLTEAY